MGKTYKDRGMYSDDKDVKNRKRLKKQSRNKVSKKPEVREIDFED